MIFIKQGIQHGFLAKGQELEYLVVKIWIVNFYNPCKKLSIELMNELAVYLGGNVICWGDFNAHSTLWGDSKDREKDGDSWRVKKNPCMS